MNHLSPSADIIWMSLFQEIYNTLCSAYGNMIPDVGKEIAGFTYIKNVPSGYFKPEYFSSNTLIQNTSEVQNEIFLLITCELQNNIPWVSRVSFLDIVYIVFVDICLFCF